MNTNFEQFGTIKTEPDIKKEPMTVNDRMLPLKENSRDILMDFGMNRKKVVHLDRSNSLLTECKTHVYSDPALSDLLSHSYPVFQEFTPKFNTWVDIDCENNLRDGTVVKVMFFPKVVETDGLNPGSIKRKRDNVDNEANPKLYRTLRDNIGRKSNSLNRCDENGRNEVIYVDSMERSDISPSFDTRGSEQEPVHRAVTPSPAAKKEQCSLLPKTIKADIHVTSTNVQPENFKDIESADLHPDFHHLPSYTVEQAIGNVRSERQILNERIPPIHLLNEENSKKRKRKKTVTPSKVQLSVGNRQGNSSQSSPANVTPARIQPLFAKEKSPPPCLGKPVEPEDTERSISWAPISPTAASKRLLWGQQNRGKEWKNTVFSSVAMFRLQGNRIKYFEKIDRTKKECIIFWGFRTFGGPNIIVPLVTFNVTAVVNVLKQNVIKLLMGYYKSSDVTIQYVNPFSTQFLSIVRKNSVMGKFFCSWPRSTKDLSPAYHAWKLIGEKVKNIPCSSKQEMISIVCGLWEKDVDVQLMCSEVISLLPQIIESVIQRNGWFMFGIL